MISNALIVTMFNIRDNYSSKNEENDQICIIIFDFVLKTILQDTK